MRTSVSANTHTGLLAMGLRAQVVRAAALAVPVALAMLLAITPQAHAVTQAEVDSAREHLYALESEYYAADAALSETLYQLDETEQKLQDTQTKIDEKGAALEAARDKLANYISSDYKSGVVSLADLVLSSSDFDELLSKIHYAVKATRERTTAINDVRTLQEDLKQEKASLEDLKTQQSELAKDQREQVAAAEDSKAAQQAYVDGLDAELYRQIEEERAAEEERRRKEAEEKAKEAEEEAQSAEDDDQADASEDDKQDDTADDSQDNADDKQDDAADDKKDDDAAAEDKKDDTAADDKKDDTAAADDDNNKQDDSKAEDEQAEPTPEPERAPESRVQKVDVTPGSKEMGRALVEAAKSQLGVRYWSCHYGPKGNPFGNGEGFGCAMFVAYAYNTVLYNGARGDITTGYPYYTDHCQGWTQSFWSAVANDNYGGVNVGFVEVAAKDAQPGDVICYVSGSNPYSTGNNCHHVAMYVGNGQQINGGGGSIHSFDMYASNLHYLHYVGQ